MIKLPDFKKAYEYENNFYLSCETSRIGKIIAHYELYKKVIDIAGEIVECGVFKGASFIRLAIFRNLFGMHFSKRIIGFDTFGKFPKAEFPKDVDSLQEFVDEAGEESISRQQLMNVLEHKDIDKYCELIEGDVIKTVPDYIGSHPELKISILNLDCDFYEASVTILKYFYPRLSKNGVLMLDNYGDFYGETKAVDEFFKDQNVTIHKLPYSESPCFIVKQ